MSFDMCQQHFDIFTTDIEAFMHIFQCRIDIG
ncbi:hypothetical protein IL54_0667 [Sphingobium sp. ba1]|nr:hypothetical protein IL54_0667 [Sphingobium sp. ba1]